MTDIKITKVNEVWLHIQANRGILQEISDLFTFYVPGYKHMPKYKNGFWDGKIRIFDSKNSRLYVGLLKELLEFIKLEQYDVEIDPRLLNQSNIPMDKIEYFVKSLNIPEKIAPREYQLKAVQTALNEKRAGFLSPTSSGKSLIIYIITQFFLKQGKEVLIIVPTTQLVSQMNNDFTEYNNGTQLDTHCIMAGVDKNIDKSCIITTWQSIYKQPKEWFKRFDAVIGDEAHLYKAASLVSILEKMEDTGYRYGFTGTLDGTLTNKLILEGLFGRFHQVTTTKKLMKDGHVSTMNIKAIVLKYTDAECKLMRANKDYHKEIDFINAHEKRNKFITNLVKSLEGNSLILFKRVDKHGKILYDMIKNNSDDDTDVFFVSGEVATDIRETIRKHVDTHKKKKCDIVASTGTFSTGTNMKKIHNVLFASPSKSRVLVLQSIGRGLRLDGDTNHMTLFDLVDDFRIGSYTNHTFKHFLERVKIYDQEEFEYKIFNYQL